MGGPVGVNPRHYQFVFSLNRQADIETPVADTALKYQRDIRSFAPIVQNRPAVISDRQNYGKGHSHPTFHDVIQKSYVLNAQDRSATNLEALYGLYYVMGNLVSTVPDSTSPNEWKHVLTWADLTNREVLYTTVLEIMGAEYTKMLAGVYLNSVTFTGNRADHVTMSFEGGGRKYVDSTVDAPGISTAVFFKTLYGLVKFGEAGSEADISAKVFSWTLTISQNATPVWRMGNASGEEQDITKVMIGDQVVSGNIVIEVDKDHRDLFLSHETVGLELICRSPDVIDTKQHELKFILPAMHISSEAFGEEEQSVTYTLTFDEDTVLKSTGKEHIQVEMLTNIDDSEIGVVSPPGTP